MIPPIQQRSLIDIKTTVQAHRTIIPGLPAAHALSGCDTVPTYFGIGKGTVLKNLIAARNSLSLLGCSDAPLPDVVDQATKFISACYSKTVHEKTMSDTRSGQRSLEILQLQPQRYKHCHLPQKHL